jgi:SAM-dependent methyltransferase
MEKGNCGRAGQAAMTRRQTIFGLATWIGARLAAGQAIDPHTRDYWNGKFKDPKTAYRRQPSRLLVESIRGRKPGLAIDLGMGDGRNAVYLALQGWQVTGVDLSDVAVGQARQHAAAAGVKLDAVIDGLDHYDLGRGRWDLITLFYVHAWYESARPRSTERIREALKPGGLLVMEGFAGDENFMFHTNQLLRDFDALRILRYEDVEDEAEWAPGRRSHLVRFVAEKNP